MPSNLGTIPANEKLGMANAIAAKIFFSIFEK